MLGILVMLVVGGIAGWIASKIMRTDAELGVVGNVVAGIVGAFVANVVVAPFTGGAVDLMNPTVPGFLLAIAGAAIALGVYNLVTKKRVR